MQLNPRYDTDPVILIDGAPADILAPVVEQRRRLAALLGTFTDEQWSHPSRCDGWSNRDVIVHLDGTNAFWTFSIAAGQRGEPTKVMAAFDPVTTPAQMVAAATESSNAEVLAGFIASTQALIDVLGSLEGDAWSAPAEAPPGHISTNAVAHHALWDSWIHERDIMLPLGLEPVEAADEIAASLRYAVALTCASRLDASDEVADAAKEADNAPTERVGKLAVTTTAPALSLVVDIDTRVLIRPGHDPDVPELVGDAVDIVEALSMRRPLPSAAPAEWVWAAGGIAELFDQR